MNPIILTPRVLLVPFILLFTFCIVYVTSAQVQQKKIVIYDKLLDYSNSNSVTALPVNSGTTDRPISNSMYDQNGNLVFYFSQDKMYDANNVEYQPPVTPANRNYGEFVVCPFPCTPKKYLVFFCSSGPNIAELYYYIADFSTSTPTFSNYTNLYTYSGPNSEQLGLALSKENANRERILYVVSYKQGLDKFVIASNGTVSGRTNLVAFNSYYNKPWIAEADLSHDGTKLGFTTSFLTSSNLVISYVNPTTGAVSSTTNVNLASYGYATGGEFNAAGNKFYFGIADYTFNNSNMGNIYYYDLNNATINLVSGTSGYGRSQIELGWDGNLHASNGSNIIHINSSNTVVGTTPLVSSYVSLGNTVYPMPDQIDGYNYDTYLNAPSVTLNTPLLCSGQSANLIATATTASGTNTGYLWSTNATSSQISISSSGTYCVTITDQSGCTASACRTLEQNPSPIIAALSNEYSNRCVEQGNVVLTAAPAAGNTAIFSTYQWSGAGLTGNLSLNTVTATPQSTTTVYTVTVTSNLGCVSTKTFTINWNNSCCPGSTITCGSQTRSLTYGEVNLSKIYADVCGTGNVVDFNNITSPANHNDLQIAVNGHLWVDGNYTIRNITYTSISPTTSGGIKFAPNVVLVVKTNQTLTIDNSYLYACSNGMWYGIQVQTNATLNTTNNTLIADAQAGVNGYGSTPFGMINLTNTRFYRNWVGVNMPNTNSYGGHINGCTFKYDPADALSNYLIAPHASQRPAIGISANNSGGNAWNIPDQIGGTANTFDGICIGVQAYYANVRVNSSTFLRIKDYNTSSAGKAINAQSNYFSAYGNSVFVQTNTNTSGTPAFNDCDYGVYSNIAHCTVQYNRMDNCLNGVYINSCNAHTVYINTNAINSTNAGITFNTVVGTGSNNQAYNNTINVNMPGINPSNTYGIGHFESTNLTDPCPGGCVTACKPLIEQNYIYQGRNGIYMNNAIGTRIYNNIIYQTSSTAILGMAAGIYGTGSRNALITSNSVYGTGAVYDDMAAATQYRKNGVYLTASPTCTLSVNKFYNIGYGSQFAASCPNTMLTGNEYGNSVSGGNKYGIVLLRSGGTDGVIGNQGSNTALHGNNFNSFSAGTNNRTYSINSNGSNSPFWVNNNGGNVNGSGDEPKYNGSNGGSPIIRGQSNSGSGAWTCTCLKSLITNSVDAYISEVAAGNADMYMDEGFEESGKWVVEKEIFTILKEDERLRKSKQLLEDFYMEKNHDALGEIAQLEDMISELNDTTVAADSLSRELLRQQAVDHNSAILATTEYEINQKWVNDFYLNTVAKSNTEFTPVQIDQLYTLASQCPYLAGDAVYSARSMYFLVNNTKLFDDDAICASAGVFKREKKPKPTQEASITMTPNPSSAQVSIAIKGKGEAISAIVYNSLGAMEGTFNFTGYTELDVTSLSNGIYHIRFYDSSGLIASKRLIVTK